MEFALAVPILLIIFLAVIDFGRAYYAGVIAEQAAREGARLGMTAVPGSEVAVSDIEDQVMNALALCSGCVNNIAINPNDVVIRVGGYDHDGNQFGYVQGGDSSDSNAVCPSDCAGGQIQVEVRFNVPLYTGFLVERLGFTSIPVRGYATAEMVGSGIF